MSRVLSEYVIKMPNVVLRDTLKSCFSECKKYFFLNLKDPLYLRFYNFSV